MISTIDRDFFLRELWEPYPAAPAKCRVVSDFLRAQDLSSEVSNLDPDILCGRLHFLRSGECELRWAGETVNVQFTPQTTWHGIKHLNQAPTDSKGAAFSLSVLRDQDLIAIWLEPQSSVKQITAARVQLLAPCLISASALNADSEAPKDAPVEAAASAAFTGQRARRWSEFLHEVRGFFRQRGFVEATTPSLVRSPGTEPFLDAFSTELVYSGPGRSQRQSVYLPTSPEFHLKKMLIGGLAERVFEIKTCFRNSEIGEHHQPEFQMLEWYRAFADLAAIENDVVGLLAWLTANKPTKKIARRAMHELFAAEFSSFALSPRTTRQELAQLAEREKIHFASDDTFDELFHRLFLARIEAKLGREGPLIVHSFPPSQAALSRIGEHGWAERFELYWNGLEIANAFHELTDANENRRRFLKDQREREALGKAAVPLDARLVEGFATGFPPSGGIALGLDRLFMAIEGINDIRSARAFSFFGAFVQ